MATTRPNTVMGARGKPMDPARARSQAMNGDKVKCGGGACHVPGIGSGVVKESGQCHRVEDLLQ